MTDPPRGPLAGRTVVITRPRPQADDLARLVQAEGGLPLVMPLIELVDVATDAEVQAALAPLGRDDWVVATSVRAAERVAPALAGCPAKVAAVGATTARSLPRVDLVATEQSAAGLVAVFPEGPGEAVVAQAEEGAPTMVEGLVGRGFGARRLVTHRSRPLVPTAEQQLGVLRADVLVFTSGTQAVQWVNIFGTSTPPVVAVIGPQTGQKAQAAGIDVHVVATDHSVSGLLTAVRDFLG